MNHHLSLLLIPCLCLSIHLHTLSFLIDSPSQITQIKMATYTKSFASDICPDPTNLLRRLIGVRGATVRGVTRGTPRGTKVTFTETSTGVLVTIEAPSIEVARTIVGKLEAIATAEPVLMNYIPSSTRRELIGMLIGKRGVILSSIGRKHNVKIFYHDEDGHFSIEGVSSADVQAAHTALHTRDEQAVLKLAVRAAPAVISLDDVPPPPPTLPLTRHNAVIDLDASARVGRQWTTGSGEHASCPADVLVSNALGIPVESVNPESVADFANKDATMGSPAWVAYYYIVAPSHPSSHLLHVVMPQAAVAGAGADDEEEFYPHMDVPPAVVRTVAGVTTHTVFVTDEEKASRDRTALIHTICGMFQARGMFIALTPDISAHLMTAAESIADEQLARDVDWDEMVACAEKEVAAKWRFHRRLPAWQAGAPWTHVSGPDDLDGVAVGHDDV
jgi:hypothetical protein